MAIGLEQFQEPTRQSLCRLLALPFTGTGGDHPMGRGSGH
jgi:hypothetical protein